MRRWAIGSAATLSACALLTDLGGLGGVDGGGVDAAADVPIDAPIDGFVITASPAHLTMDKGDAFPVTITVTRGGAFTGLVNINVNGLEPPKLSASTPTVITGNTGTFNVSLVELPTQVDYMLDVVGTSADGTKNSHASLGVHVGSLIVAATADTIAQIPPFATSITVKAWGAGGGGGEGATDSQNLFTGGYGGSGGFASANLPVTPGETLQLWVGGGGASSAGRPGAGGGFSAVLRGTTQLLVAGGGGGGGAALQSTSQNNQCFVPGASGSTGAAGGGAQGETRANAAAPGTPTAGGAGGPTATAGASQQGGHGGPGTTGSGGAHGGGGAGNAGAFCGLGGGGGGGGGFFGGGGGGTQTNKPGAGGGGGSGYADPSATQVTLTAGKGQNVPNATDADWASNAGAGGIAGQYVSCNPSCTYQNPAPGSAGRVVVRLTKP